MLVKIITCLFFLATYHLVATQSGRYFVNEQDDCQTVQAFQPGKDYLYHYEGIVEHNTTQDNGFKIKCSRVKITVLASCAARLKMGGCVLSQARERRENGRMLYQEASARLKKKFTHALHSFHTYFYFNKGEITKMFFHRNERDDVGNIKKAVLFALSLKYTGQGYREPTTEPIKISSNSIYGSGEASATVTQLPGSKLNVTTTRRFSEHELSSDYQGSKLRFPGRNLSPDEGDIVTLIGKQVLSLYFKNYGNFDPVQTCHYVVKRKRRVDEVVCKETHLIPFGPEIDGYEEDKREEAKNYFMSTNVVLRLSFQKTDHASLMTSRDNEIYQQHYKEENIFFNSDLDGNSKAFQPDFDPYDAFMRLIQEPVFESAPIFSKLTIWAVGQSETVLNQLANRIFSSITEQHPTKTREAGNIWVQLLSGCTRPEWCTSETDCSNTNGCQDSLASVAQHSNVANETILAKYYLLDILSSIKRPTSNVLEVILGWVRANTTAENINSLGKVLINHNSLIQNQKSDQLISESLSFLQNLIERDCQAAKSSERKKRIVVSAINAGNVFVKSHQELLEKILACSEIPNTPNAVLIAAVQAMSNGATSNSRVREILMNFFTDESLGSHVRLPSALALLLNQPSRQELRTIFVQVNAPNEVSGIQSFIHSYISSQIQLTGTKYESLDKETIDKIVELIRQSGAERDYPEMGSETRTEHMEREVPVYLPLLKQTLPLTFRRTLYFHGQNIAPFLIELTATTMVDDNPLTLLELKTDVGKVTSILKPLLGQNGYLPLDMLRHIMDIPIFKWPQLLTIQIPSLSSTSLKSLLLIKDQFQMAEILSSIEKKPILDIKLLGKPISVGPMFSNDDSLAKLLEGFKMLEKGIDLNFFLLNTMGHFQSQVPTSIGLPLLTNWEMTNFFKQKLKLQAPLKELLFTRRGNITFEFNPTSQFYENLERIMKPPLGDASGSATLVEYGYHDHLRLHLRKTADKLTIHPIRPNRRTEILNTRTYVLAPPGSSSSIMSKVSSPENCSAIRIRKVFLETFLKKEDCGSLIAPHKSVYFVESSGNPVKFDVSWEQKLRNHQNEDVQANSLKLGVRYFIRPNEEEHFWLKSWNYPTHNAMEFEAGKNSRTLVTGTSNFLIGFDEENQVLNSIFTSFNLSVPLMPMALLTSSFSLQRSSDNLDIPSKLTLLGLNDHFKNGVGPGYDLSGKLKIPTLNTYYSYVGFVPVPTDEGRFTALVKVSSGFFETSYGTLVYDKDFMTENERQIPVIEITFNETSSTDLNKYHCTKLHMTWKNDTAGYHKILRFETWNGKNKPGPFLDLRQRTVFDSTNGPNCFDWNATVTTKKFQGQWRADARDPEKLTIKSRIVVPSSDISMTKVLSRSYEEIKVSAEGLDVKVGGVDVVAGTRPEGQINATVYVLMNQIKSYVHVSKNQVNCPYCLLVDVDILTGIKGNFVFQIKPTLLQSEFSLSLPSNMIKTNNLPRKFFTYDGNQVTVAYVVNVNINFENLNVNGKFKTGSYECDLTGSVNWDLTNTLTNNFYNSQSELVCSEQISANRVIEDFSMQGKFNFSTATSGENKQTRKINFWKQSRKGDLMVTSSASNINLTSTGDRFDQLLVSATSQYSLSKSDFNKALQNKSASMAMNFTRHDVVQEQFTFPAYNLRTEARIPVQKNVPGGSNFEFAHNGVYFYGNENQDTFDQVCNSNAECEAKYQTLMQNNVEESDETLVRFSDFATDEFDQFSTFPWEQLQKIMESPSFEKNTENPFNLDIFELNELSLKSMRAFRNYITSSNESKLQLLFKTLKLERKLFKMQNYFMVLSETTNDDEFDLTKPKSQVESYFRDIYELDNAIGSALSNPLVVPNQAVQFRNYLKRIQSEGEKTYKTFGISYSGTTQFITMNSNYHVIPSFANQNCSWLGSVDVPHGIITITFQRSGLVINFLDETLLQLRDGSFQLLNGNGEESSLEYPFMTKKCFCQKLSEKVVECFNFYTYMKFTYDESADVVLYYVELTGDLDFSKQFIGMNGVATKHEVPIRLLPDGGSATNEANFINSYELSQLQQCRFINQDFQGLHLTLTDDHVCERAFSPISFPSSFERERDALLQACYDRAVTQQDTCKYTSLFVESLRRGQFPTSSDPSCLTCGINDEVFVQINRFRLLLVISLSEDMDEKPTKRFFSKLVRNSLQQLRDNGISDVSVTVVTYGGEMQTYPPAIVTIQNSVSSSNLKKLKKTLSSLSFSGPSYDPRSTVDAMEFVANYLGHAYEGIAQSVVLAAPETIEKNIGGQIPTYLTELFNENLMNMYLVTSMDASQCTSNWITLPSQTGGECISMETQEIVERIRTYCQEKVGRSASCSCTENPETGEIRSRCILTGSSNN